MTLVDRATVQQQVSEEITRGLFMCNAEYCLCLEKIKNKLKYTILSHRWGFPELTFGDFGKLYESTNQHNPSSSDAILVKMQQLWENTPFKTSLDKILHFRKVSIQKRCKYAWIDTVCINKESSTELDESIRSMYAWYRDSHICIVHLNKTHFSTDLRYDPWFTRGWTLQELLAPKRIKFFSSSWGVITHRENDKDLNSMERQAAKQGQDQPPLWSRISDITGIPIDDLFDFKPGLYDIGKRMRWASRRTTTRVEDMAYCLIGMFRVNLSISYGEKEGAFYRLQAEIMQNSDDQSLFDWEGEASAYNSMFAVSPKCFSRVPKIRSNNTPPSIDTDQSLAMAANFERRVSRLLYHKSEVPNLALWRGSGATAFTILGPSLTEGECTLMLLEQVGTSQYYQRIEVVNAKIERELPPKNPSEILIK